MLVGTRLAPPSLAMRLRRLLRKLKIALAGLAGGFAFACSGPNPGEVPPLAPRPEPVTPMPSQPERKSPLPEVVPGAPDPLDRPQAPPPDAGVTELPTPQLKSSHEPMHTPTDAGVHDAVTLPENVPDALPPDAGRRPESVSTNETTSFNCC